MQNVDISGAAWFTPRSQESKPEEERVRYKIRGLIGTEAMDVNFHEDEDGWRTMTARGGNACLRCGLLGWERLTDKDGQAVEFDPKDWRGNIARLNPLDVVQIALEIWNRTFPTEEARKN